MCVWPAYRSPKQSKYGFVERVVDSITVHINKLHLHIRTLGKMKCEPIGPWTPPVIEIILEHVKYCSTDPNGDVSASHGMLDCCFATMIDKAPRLCSPVACSRRRCRWKIASSAAPRLKAKSSFTSGSMPKSLTRT